MAAVTGATGATSPAAPSSSPIPLASGDYATAAATANAAYSNALASINNQRQQALQSFGYTGTIDPTTGQLTNMQVDPNNPYGQYQQMLGQGAADQQAVQAGAEARGLGSVLGPRGGGLAAQSLSNAKLAFGGQSAGLGENLMGTLGGLTEQQNQAQDTMNNALWQAELASAQNAIANQDFNPADFTGITDQPVPGGAVPAPQTITVPSNDGAPGGGSGTTKINTGDSWDSIINNNNANSFQKAFQSKQKAKSVVKKRGGGSGARVSAS
jgi:hypothetical protein